MDGSGPDNVDAVRRYFDGLERGDWAVGAQIASPDLVSSWEEPAQLIEVRGTEQVRLRLGEFLRQWSRFEVTANSIEPLGSDGVLVTAHQVGVGKASGAVTEQDIHIGFRFEDGQATEIHWRFDRDEAIRVTGLDPATPNPLSVVDLVTQEEPKSTTDG